MGKVRGALRAHGKLAQSGTDLQIALGNLLKRPGTANTIKFDFPSIV